MNSGEDYLTVLPAIQIGILDFPLFEDRQEFYSSYLLLNEKTHEVYSDKLRLNVLELRKSNLASEEDKKWKIDKWAKFFKAATWEAIEMLAKDLPVLDEAAETIYHISMNDRIRERCEAREDFFRRQRTTEKLMAIQEEKISAQKEKISAQEVQLSAKDAQLSAKEKEISMQKDMLKKMKALLLANGVDPDQMK